MRSWIHVFLALALLGGCYRRSRNYFFATPWPGDYNANGLSDILLGAPLDDASGAPGSQRGRVYLHAGAFGGPSPIPTALYDGTEDGGRFGAAVAAIGDFNGDGFPDFAVGAPFESGAVTGDQRGKVYVFLGGSSFPTVPSLTLVGAEDNGHFGAAVGRAGDVNSNGRDKLVVGAPDESGTGAAGSQRGRAYIFSWSGGTTPILTLNGTEDGGRFGAAVDTAGDMNGDGFFDVAVGAPMENAGGGRVYVFYGGFTLSTTPGLTLTGAAGSQFGSSVAGLLDFNFDGFDDLAVGAPLDPAGGAGAGRAFVFHGAPSPGTSAALTITGVGGSHLGAMVARIGDINAGGAPDLLVGAPLDDGGGLAGSQRGRAFIFFGGPSADNVPDVLISGQVDMGHFGSSGFSGGDANGDGIRDLVIGAPDDNTNGAGSGRAFFYLGGTSMGTVPAQTFEGAKQAGAQLGAAVQ